MLLTAAGLTAYDLQLKPQPMLAESWELSPDATQVKLNLRKGVQWHNGRELTSDPKALALLTFAEIPFFMALPLVAPPDLPADRVKALQNGFMAMTMIRACGRRCRSWSRMSPIFFRLCASDTNRCNVASLA